MKPNPGQVRELIERFQNNECTPAEIRLLQQWIGQLDVNDESMHLSSSELEAMKNQMYRHLISQRPVAMHRRRNSRRRYMAAAGWLVLIASSIVLYHFFGKPTAPSQQAPVFTTIYNNQQGVKKITLPDGTVVCLNRNSQLVFDEAQYNHTERFVTLQGEGYFEVTKDPRRPFIVATGNLRTRVLGTAFNIEAYHHESEIRVSLVHGKIALNDTASDKTTLLSPDQTFRYSKHSRTWEVLPVDAQRVALWTQGWLVFNEVPLTEAVQRLQEKYHLVIDYKPELLRDKRITASFNGATWQTALENILFVHGLHFRKKGEKLSIVD